MHSIHSSVKPLSIFDAEEVYLFVLFLYALKTVFVLITKSIHFTVFCNAWQLLD